MTDEMVPVPRAALEALAAHKAAGGQAVNLTDIRCDDRFYGTTALPAAFALDSLLACLPPKEWEPSEEMVNALWRGMWGQAWDYNTVLRATYKVFSEEGMIRD